MTEKIEVLEATSGRGWDVVAGETTYMLNTHETANRVAELGADWLAANLIGFPTEVVRRETERMEA